MRGFFQNQFGIDPDRAALMSNEQDWADWVARLAPAVSALSTFSAVATSLWLAGRQGRQARASQAEQVTAWHIPYDGRKEDHRVGLLIKNASNQLVYDVIVQVVNNKNRQTAVGDTYERNHELGVCIGNVPPGEFRTHITQGSHGMDRRFGIEIAFQDAAGRYWVRRGDGKLTKVKKHPLDLYNMHRPAVWRISDMHPGTSEAS